MHLQNHPSSDQWRNLIFKITLASLLLSRSASSAHKILTIAMNPVLDLNGFWIITTKFKNLIIMHYLGSALIFLWWDWFCMHVLWFHMDLSLFWFHLIVHKFQCKHTIASAKSINSLWLNVSYICIQLFSSLFMEMTARDGYGVVFCFVFGQWYGVVFLFVFSFVF